MTLIGAVLLGPAIVSAFVAADALWLVIRRRLGGRIVGREREPG